MKKQFNLQENGVYMETTVPVHTILTMSVELKENEHARGVIEAEVPEEYREMVQSCAFGGDQITIRGKENKVLFAGLIEKVELQMVNKWIKAVIHCVSSTICLDTSRKKRCFQNPRLTYTQVINKVLGKYENAFFRWQTGKDREAGAPLIQYDETDWEFLKRLASHFHTVLYPIYDGTGVSFYFGCRKGLVKAAIDPGGKNFLSYGISDSYYTQGGFEENRSRESASFIEIAAEEELDIGDVIQYERKRYTVYRKTICFGQGELTCKYLLGTDYFIYRRRAVNELLAGVSVKGEVKKTEGEEVYLQLEMEDEEAAQYPWPWAPETGNLCYCMPETGTKVMLYFASGEEKDGLALHALRTNQESGVFLNDQYREMHTLQDKRLGLYPDKLFVEGKAKASSIYIEDEEGIQLKSKKNIRMDAGRGVYIKGKKSAISAPMEIVCRTSSSNIEINRDFNFYAPGGVQTCGSGDAAAPLPPLEASKEKTPEHWQLSYSAMAAVPAADFTNDEDGIIDLMAAAAVPKVVEGRTTAALSEVMAGKPESEARYSDSLRSMEIYTVKGGYALPSEKR